MILEESNVMEGPRVIKTEYYFSLINPTLLSSCQIGTNPPDIFKVKLSDIYKKLRWNFPATPLSLKELKKLHNYLSECAEIEGYHPRTDIKPRLLLTRKKREEVFEETGGGETEAGVEKQQERKRFTIDLDPAGKFLSGTGKWFVMALFWVAHMRVFGGGSLLKNSDFYRTLNNTFQNLFPQEKDTSKDEMLNTLKETAKWQCNDCQQEHIWGRDAERCKKIFPERLDQFCNYDLIHDEIKVHCLAKSNVKDIRDVMNKLLTSLEEFEHVNKELEQIMGE